MNQQKRSMPSLQILVRPAWPHAAEGDNRRWQRKRERIVLKRRIAFAPADGIDINHDNKTHHRCNDWCDYAISLIPDDCCAQLSRFPKAIIVRMITYDRLHFRPRTFTPECVR